MGTPYWGLKTFRCVVKRIALYLQRPSQSKEGHGVPGKRYSGSRSRLGSSKSKLMRFFAKSNESSVFSFFIRQHADTISHGATPLPHEPTEYDLSDSNIVACLLQTFRARKHGEENEHHVHSLGGAYLPCYDGFGAGMVAVPRSQRRRDIEFDQPAC